MKKKILSLAVLFLASIMIFTGCGFKPLTGGPAKTDAVIGNGKMVVQKGNYLYYVNGYKKIDDIKEGDNKFGNADFGAIYRAELDNNGNLLKDDDGKVITEVLAPKIVGTEKASFFIFDDKIYYASPNTEKDGSGKVDNKLTDFYMSNLDGSGVKEIYKTEVSSTSYQFAFYKVNGKVVLALFDSSNLYIIDCASKSKIFTAKTVRTVAMPTEYEILPSTKDALKNIYYTRAVEGDDYNEQGDIVAYVSLSEREEHILDEHVTVKVIDIKDEYLIYTKSETNSVAAYYYKSKFVNGSIKTEAAEQLSVQAFDNSPYVLDFENGNYCGMIVKNASGYLTLIKSLQNGLPVFESLNDEVKLTPLAVFGDEVYAYNADNELYKLNYKTKVLTKLSSKDDAKLDFGIENNIDFDGKYVYVYQTLTGDEESAIYLARIDTTTESEVETVGNVLDKHIKTAE